MFSNLFVFLDKITRALDRGEDLDVINLDFTKAFEEPFKMCEVSTLRSR